MDSGEPNEKDIDLDPSSEADQNVRTEGAAYAAGGIDPGHPRTGMSAAFGVDPGVVKGLNAAINEETARVGLPPGVW